MTTLALVLTIIGGLTACTSFLADPYTMPKLVCMAAGIALLWARAATTPPGRLRLRPSPLSTGILAFGLAMALTTAFSADRYVSLIGERLAMFHSCLAYVLVVAAFYAAAVLADELPLDRIVGLAVLAGFLATLYGFLQAIGLEPFFPWGLPNGRITGPQGSPVYLGAMLAVLAPLAFDAALRSSQRRFFWGPTAFSWIAVALVLTGSRGALAAMLAGVAALLAGRLGLRPRHLRAAALVGLVAVGAGAAATWKPGRDVGRVEIWKAAGKAFLARPLLGHGPDTFTLAFRQHVGPGYLRIRQTSLAATGSAHNDVLQVAATMGLVGLAAYGLLLFGLGATLVQAARSGHSYGPAVTGAVVALFVQAKVNPVPLGVLVLVAVLVGRMSADIYRGRWNAEPTDPRLTRTAALALAGVAVLVLRLAAAERAERRATLAAAAGDTVRVAVEANRAAQLNPWEMQYRLNQLATLHGMTFLAPEAERPGMAGLAVRIAREAAEMHPRDPGAHEVLGTALLHETMHTRPDRTSAAQAALDRAQDLAPTYVPLMERRIALAGARGDIARRVLIEADRCAVLETTGEGACR